MKQSARPRAPLALIAAGGEGKRLGSIGPKALVLCAGKPLLGWCLDAFARSEAFAGGRGRVVVAAHASELEAFDAAVEPARSAGLEVLLCEGGPSRSHSVRAALQFALKAAPASESGDRPVLVHDAARPLAGPTLIDACVAALAPSGGATRPDALVPAAPVTDTIKQAGRDGTVLATLDRNTLWAVQTPQAFVLDVLIRALGVAPAGPAVDDATLAAATDDASLVERAGGTVKILPWTDPNPKITTEADLASVAQLMRTATRT
jgi:2-C-methyl-D-erythritol 4-phosphate cytidylyltransferase